MGGIGSKYIYIYIYIYTYFIFFLLLFVFFCFLFLIWFLLSCLLSYLPLSCLLKIKRKLELNMYLYIKSYLKCLALFYLFGSSHRLCFVEVGVLRGFAGFTGELLRWGLFFNIKLQASSLWPQ